jgi:3',5'-cyclic AMP phosphodiesterase CpdA
MGLVLDRRQFARLAGLAGIAFASGLAGARPAAAADDFYFVQLSDTHWGFKGPPDPLADEALPKAVAAINALDPAPDFLVFTGDLTHTTDDEAERRRRMAQFRDHVSKLKVKTLHFMPGEHDAALDKGGVFIEAFGETHYSFEHKGITFIVLDNVSDPKAHVGETQLAWLKMTLAGIDKAAPIVVFTHRPLFDLYPQWDWATADGAAVLALFAPYRHVTVFYGHIHQEHHQMTGHIAHHAATSLIFPLPAPGSQPKRAPLAWDPASPFKGLGWRLVAAHPMRAAYDLAEHPLEA